MEFNKAYNRQEFTNFLQQRFLPEDFIPTVQEVTFTTQMCYSTKAVKLGTSSSLDLVVYEIKHNSTHDARVSLSKEAFRLLADEMEDRALVLFVPEDDNSTYRFSFIEITLDANEKGTRISRSYSNPRRYSYLLGRGIAYYTPNKYLNEKGRIVNDEDLHSRFSVEVLTKEFYNELSDWYAWAIQIISFPNDINDDTDNARYNNESAIRLITRLIFVWFLKQRHLIPDEFFDEKYIANNLIDNFNPHAMVDLFSKSNESKYYKAILQNLFFAMLNSPITAEGSSELSERRFRSGRGDYDNNKLMRYENYFSHPQLFVDLANHTVPFLNGGLFDCLDDKDHGMYYDGFSDRESIKKSLIVPDYLFFGEEVGKNIDLSEWYGDKKKKKVSARGIIDILKRYNFTVEENTPFDKEVSLDPELLGKVFENLLASFNPETQTTARKQTGSFYTPREIVQYMVDESLIAHLKRTVGEELEPQFRLLLQYTDDPIAFTNVQRQSIMRSLYECKILDPACGSGAFPMGILQQMVHILGRIDPENEQWRDMMMNQAINETSEVYRTASAEERAELVTDIERSFDENINRPDYARKLYLIENCIYGVDIQPIAIQISKLRFFISLVVDQNTNTNPADNFGIRPLPNLEAKFVAANTLIGLNKKVNLFDSDAIKEKEEELKVAKHKIFSAKTIRTKRKYRQMVNDLRLEIATMLQKNNAIGNAEASQLATWDMFDQNSSSPFFDSEWMFGVKDGFDIVIANPPYIDIKGLPAEDVKLYFRLFDTTENRINLYSIFIEKGTKFLSSNGILCYINPNSILINESYRKIRKHILNSVDTIVKLPDKVFESAIVETIILLLIQGNNSNWIKGAFFKKNDITNFFDLSFSLFDRRHWMLDSDYRFNIFTTKRVSNLLDKIQENTKELGEYVFSSLGITPYDKYKGHDETTIKERKFHSKTKLDNTYVPLISGKNIHPFYVSNEITEYLKYGDWLGAPRERFFFEKPKIIVRQILAGEQQRIIAAYSEKSHYFTQIGFSLISKEDNSNILKFITCILNSSLMSFYHRNVFLDLEKVVFQKILIANAKKLPIKNTNNISNFMLLFNNADSIDMNKLDLLVYHLYNLTYDEVLIVDPETVITREEYAKEN